LPVRREHGHQFGDVHGAAAAQAVHEIVFMFPRRRYRRLDHRFRLVGRDGIEQPDGEPLLRQTAPRSLDQPAPDQSGVGHNERPPGCGKLCGYQRCAPVCGCARLTDYVGDGAEIVGSCDVHIWRLFRIDIEACTKAVPADLRFLAVQLGFDFCSFESC
jgi:hypothetical protein